MRIIIYIFLLISQITFSQIKLQTQFKENSQYFPIITNTITASICYDKNDYASVQKTAGLLATDIKNVTGKLPNLISSKSEMSEYVIIIGTVEKSQLIRELVKNNKLNVDSINNKWECFTIKTIDKPFKGVKKALIIAGSDRRGASYGTFTLSESIGVSPWYWWADVPVLKRNVLAINKIDYVSKSPTIKYRGIFINDEDWGLKPWASKNYEKELGDIGPKTYAQVCELLLRLKANMFAPAMHSCTGAFYSHSDSKVVADQYGIMITTSHCEPLLFNNAAKSEWDAKVDGDWNYGTNKDRILNKLDNRVKEASKFENVYTVGLRGLHDEGMRGNFSREEKVKIVDRAIADQRSILQKYIQKPKNSIPQIYVPYKEALDVYNDGLEVPDDVTLVWVDDNYGYMKRLSTPEEQKRVGGAGVYYHTSYLGGPHDYLWLCTTPPVLMYEELKKAYNTGANRYWLLNIGDIKPAELGMQTFFDLAWNINSYDEVSINKHQSQFLAQTFGTKYETEFQDILDNYYRLAWSRKPEFMGWERQWDAPKYRDVNHTDFSFENYNDAQQRIADYKRISDLSEKISKELPENSRPAFYEFIGYSVMGSCQMNRKFLLAQLSNEQVTKNNQQAAIWAANESKKAYDSINNLTLAYNTMLNGKWKGMMEIAPGWAAKHHTMPKVIESNGQNGTAVNLEPQKDKNKREGFTVINLKQINNKVSSQGHTLKTIEGVGYDWFAIKLGEATEETSDPTNLMGSRYEYEFTTDVDTDSITVHSYSLPFFALYNGKSTRYGISVDGQQAFVAQNDHKEFSEPWKDRVLQNGALTTARFKIDKNIKKHKISIICGDPGMIIERIIIDWGGLKKSYVGPSMW